MFPGQCGSRKTESISSEKNHNRSHWKETLERWTWYLSHDVPFIAALCYMSPSELVREEDVYENSSIKWFLYGWFEIIVQVFSCAPGIMRFTILVYPSLVIITIYIVCQIYGCEYIRRFWKKWCIFTI